jgi:GR25 family glycosyltransferase involved in LPS biosynthesis
MSKTTSHGLLDHIVYINRDDRLDRRIHVAKELDKLSPPNGFERIAATVPKSGDGALGCSMSHIRALELAKSKKWPQVMICEDDITFLDAPTFLQKLSEFAAAPPVSASPENPENWQVLIVCGNNVPPHESTSNPACIRVTSCQAATGYIVQSHYYDTLLNNFREGTKLLLQNPSNRREYAVDMYWKRLQSAENGRWYMLIPVTTTQYPNYSDIEKRETDYTKMMLDVEKTAWVEAQRRAGSEIQSVIRNPRRIPVEESGSTKLVKQTTARILNQSFGSSV